MIDKNRHCLGGVIVVKIGKRLIKYTKFVRVCILYQPFSCVQYNFKLFPKVMSTDCAL